MTERKSNKHVPGEKVVAKKGVGKVRIAESIRNPKPPTIAQCQKKNLDGFFASAVPKSEGKQSNRNKNDGEEGAVTITEM